MGTKFKIKLHKENTNLFITIDDDGSGIPKKNMKMCLNHSTKLIKEEQIQNQA